MPSAVTLRAYAKINLHLRIGQRDRTTGYHALETLFQTVSLYDTIRLTRAKERGCPKGTERDAGSGGEKNLRLGGRLGEAPPGRDNLVLRAAEALQERTGTTQGARIHLTKRIPVAAGMGGGSTDAAAALYGLDHLWHTRLTQQKLKNLAKYLGADVPFLLTGGSAVGTRTGDRLRPGHAPERPWWIVLVTSRQGVSTADAYGGLTAADRTRGLIMDSPPSAEVQALGRAWSRGDWPQPTVNSFERSLFAARPRLGELVERLKAGGAVTAHLSGSGPTVFGLFDSARAARAAREGLPLEADESAILARPAPQTPEITRLSP